MPLFVAPCDYYVDCPIFTRPLSPRPAAPRAKSSRIRRTTSTSCWCRSRGRRPPTCRWGRACLYIYYVDYLPTGWPQSPRIVFIHREGRYTPKHRLSPNKMALITSDCGTKRPPEHQMALTTSECRHAGLHAGNGQILDQRGCAHGCVGCAGPRQLTNTLALRGQHRTQPM